MRRLTAATLLIAAIAGPAPASERAVPPSRYAFVPVQAGALRLDTETGEVSLCAARSGAARCTRVAENIRLTLGERAQLELRMEEFEARVRALEAATSAETARSAEAEAIARVDRLAGRMMRHFLGLVQAVKREVATDEL